MWVLRKDEDEWWFARHSDGREGSIPVPYVTVVSLGKLGGRREGGREREREGGRRESDGSIYSIKGRKNLSYFEVPNVHFSIIF